MKHSQWDWFFFAQEATKQSDFKNEATQKTIWIIVTYLLLEHKLLVVIFVVSP